MTQHDQLHRYLFENYAVRGELVTVSETLEQILANHSYPQPVKTVLAELLVATSLLTATLKFDGYHRTAARRRSDESGGY